jgi:DNA-binding phage protein
MQKGKYYVSPEAWRLFIDNLEFWREEWAKEQERARALRATERQKERVEVKKGLAKVADKAGLKPADLKTKLAKGKEGGKRVDRIAAICTRLFLHVTAEKYREQPQHAANFAEFLLQEAIPNDLRGGLMMDLSRHESAGAKQLLKDKRLAKLLLEKI